MESLKHLNTLHAWKTVEYLFFFPFKNISKHPPMSQSKQILQLSFQPLSQNKVEFLSSLLFGGWCIFVGAKKRQKKEKEKKWLNY